MASLASFALNPRQDDKKTRQQNDNGSKKNMGLWGCAADAQPKKCLTNSPFSWIGIWTVIWQPFFLDLSQIEKLSEIKLPLSLFQNAKKMTKLWLDKILVECNNVHCLESLEEQAHTGGFHLHLLDFPFV
jgi:hypothetical protein